MKFNSIVTDEIVLEMKKDYMNGLTATGIAKKYGIKTVTAIAILKERSYKYVVLEGYKYNKNTKTNNRNFDQETLLKIKDDVQLSGETKQDIATRYGVSKVTIYKLIKKYGW